MPNSASRVPSALVGAPVGASVVSTTAAAGAELGAEVGAEVGIKVAPTSSSRLFTTPSPLVSPGVVDGGGG